MQVAQREKVNTRGCDLAQTAPVSIKLNLSKEIPQKTRANVKVRGAGEAWVLLGYGAIQHCPFHSLELCPPLPQVD